MTDVERSAPPVPARSLRDVIEAQQGELARALPAVLSPDRFMRLLLTEVRAIPRLAECSHTSVLSAAMRSAQLGLEPGGPLGLCYFLPFKNKDTGQYEASFILGYKGIVNLCHRSDGIRSIYAREVCERDEFDFAYGLSDRLEHKPAPSGHRGPPTAFYGVAHFRGGGHYFLVMNKDEVDEHRARSKSPERGPWVTDYNAMGRKTVIRAMAPFLPLTAEVAVAIDQDDRVIRQADNDDFYDVMPDTP